MAYPTDFKYTKEHEWIKVDGKNATVGITTYAQELLDEIDTLDWPDRVKPMQRNWIGRSEGARLRFSLDGHDEALEVFTTLPRFRRRVS